MDGNHASDLGSLIPEQLEPLSRFFGRKDLTEVWVNEPRQVWLRLADRPAVCQPAPDLTLDWAWDLCKFLANRNGILFSEKMPIIACRIPGGHRFQAILGPNVESKIAIAIRLRRPLKFDYTRFGLVKGRKIVPPEDLYQDDERSSELECRSRPNNVGTLEDLLDQVRKGKPVLVSGGTNTGKTSFLNQLVSEIPPDERIVTVEDAREIILPHENKVHLLVSRTATGTDVDYASIINAILRLSPDIVLLGEVSVDNSYPLLRLLNTGHEGFIGTVHANNPLEALEALKRNIELAGHSAQGAVPFLARTLSRIVQIQKREGEERRVVAIQRPLDLDWRSLL